MSAKDTAGLSLPGGVARYAPDLFADMIEGYAYALADGPRVCLVAFGQIENLRVRGDHPVSVDPAAILGKPREIVRTDGRRRTELDVVFGLDRDGQPMTVRVSLDAPVARVTRAIRAARGCP
jgi:hypothetical protein